MSFPLGWTVHPKFLNSNLLEGRMHLANYESLNPKPVPNDPTKPLKVWVIMGGETSERQVRRRRPDSTRTIAPLSNILKFINFVDFSNCFSN
jgi:hypothetical protein